MSSTATFRTPQAATVILVLALATALKVFWALNSIGSCDMVLFYVYAKGLQHIDLAQAYRASELFNHTPAVAMALRWLYAACQGDMFLFSAIFRGLSILADIVVVGGLIYVRQITGRPPWWAIMLFAISPVSIMVSGFHGNLDPILVALLFFAGVAVLRDCPALSGLLLGAACNVKVMPLLLAPVFFFYWYGRGWRPLGRFLAPVALLLLAGSAWPLAVCPQLFFHNVLGYGSIWGTWGIPYWLRMTGWPAFQIVDFRGLDPVQLHIMAALKSVIIAATLALAWRRRLLPPLEFFSTLGAAFIFLFVFAPGSGPQYNVWFAPFLLFLAPRWGVALTATCAVYMVLFYHSAAKFVFPWNLALPQPGDIPFWAPWTNLAWLTFVALLVWRGPSWFLLSREEPGPVASPVLCPVAD